MTKRSYFDDQIKRLIELSGLNQSESNLENIQFPLTKLVDDKEDDSLVKVLLSEIKANHSNQLITDKQDKQDKQDKVNLAWSLLKQKVLQENTLENKATEKSSNLDQLSSYNLVDVSKQSAYRDHSGTSVSNKPQFEKNPAYLVKVSNNYKHADSHFDTVIKQLDQFSEIENDYLQADNPITQSNIQLLQSVENKQPVDQAHLAIDSLANNSQQHRLDQDFKKLVHFFEKASQESLETPEFPDNLRFFEQEKGDEFAYINSLIESYEDVYPEILEDTLEQAFGSDDVAFNNQQSPALHTAKQLEDKYQFSRDSSDAVIKQIEQLFFLKELQRIVSADHLDINSSNQFNALEGVIINLADQYAISEDLNPYYHQYGPVDDENHNKATPALQAKYQDVINSLEKLSFKPYSLPENFQENILQSICQPLSNGFEAINQAVLSPNANTDLSAISEQQLIQSDSNLGFDCEDESLQFIDSSGNLINLNGELLLENRPVITMGNQRLGIFAEDLIKEVFQSSLLILKQLEINFNDNLAEKNFFYYTSTKVLSSLIAKDNADFLKLTDKRNNKDKLLNGYLGLNSSYHGNIKLLTAGFSFDGHSLNRFAVQRSHYHQANLKLSISFTPSFFSQNSENISPYGSIFEEQEQASLADNKSLAIYRCLYLESSSSFITLAKRNKLSFYLEDKELAEQNWQQYNQYLNEQQKVSIILTQLKQIKANIQLLNEIKNIDIEKYHKLIALILAPVSALTKYITYQEENECSMFAFKYISSDEMIPKGYYEFKPVSVDYPLNVAEHIESITLAPHSGYFVESLVREKILDSGLNIGLNKLQVPIS